MVKPYCSCQFSFLVRICTPETASAMHGFCVGSLDGRDFCRKQALTQQCVLGFVPLSLGDGHGIQVLDLPGNQTAREMSEMSHDSFFKTDSWLCVPLLEDARNSFHSW